MITVSRQTNPLEAYIIRGRLEAEGLSAVVLFEQHIWAMWSYSNALGGVRVLVPLSEYEAAQGVMNALDDGEYEDLLLRAHPVSVTTCPRCGSQNTAPHEWLWKIALAVLFLTPFVLPYTTHLYSCDDCRRSWIAYDQRPYPLYVIAIAITLIAMLPPIIFGILIYNLSPDFRYS
jgi:hypothetical protein